MLRGYRNTVFRTYRSPWDTLGRQALTTTDPPGRAASSIAAASPLEFAGYGMRQSSGYSIPGNAGTLIFSRRYRSSRLRLGKRPALISGLWHFRQQLYGFHHLRIKARVFAESLAWSLTGFDWCPSVALTTACSFNHSALADLSPRSGSAPRIHSHQKNTPLVRGLHLFTSAIRSGSG
jgi:hypothetical protein